MLPQHWRQAPGRKRRRAIPLLRAPVGRLKPAQLETHPKRGPKHGTRTEYPQQNGAPPGTPPTLILS
eukprot:7392241-Pyramimonas_sp.AAC.1